MKVIFLTIVSVLFSLTSFACTTCNSKQATDVRSLVFGDDFYTNVSFSILPFIVFAGIVTWIYKGGKTDQSKTKIE